MEGGALIVIGSCVPDGGETFRSRTLPGLHTTLQPGDLVVTESGTNGICAAYNALIDLARSRADCELLVLLHDDVEVVDHNLRAKLLLGASKPGAGVLGVVGAKGLRSLAWWDARSTAGRVFETRMYTDLGPRSAEVDCVDGLFMALTPAAFAGMRFDQETFPLFHGYDVDFCLQAISRGLMNFVLPVSLVHHTKGGYGDPVAFERAAAALATKWPQFVKPQPAIEVAARQFTSQTRRLVSGATRRIRRQCRSTGTDLKTTPVAPGPKNALTRSPMHAHAEPEFVFCPVCDEDFLPAVETTLGNGVVECPSCGLGVTWPPPVRDVGGSGLWEERYGGNRLLRRDMWFGEARSRIDWVKLSAPDGALLEVGCGTGEFVKVAQENDYESYGVEPSAWGAEQARLLGVDVVTGYLEDWCAEYPGLQPDVVALWHVLEHVPQPGLLLRDIRQSIRPGARVFLEVPNFESTGAKSLGRDWDALQPDDHFYHFGPASLPRLVARSGFTVEQVLEISPRIYHSASSWNRLKNKALVDGHPWPSLDFLRIAAVAS